jgi:hypothetical protein
MLAIPMEFQMNHYLTMGYLDYQLPNTLHIVVRKPLPMDIVMRLLREVGKVDPEGNATLGGYPVEFEDGCVICPWIMAETVQETAEFAERLHEETGCAVIDREHGIEYYKEKGKE